MRRLGRHGQIVRVNVRRTGGSTACLGGFHALEFCLVLPHRLVMLGGFRGVGAAELAHVGGFGVRVDGGDVVAAEAGGAAAHVWDLV